MLNKAHTTSLISKQGTLPPTGLDGADERHEDGVVGDGDVAAGDEEAAVAEEALDVRHALVQLLQGVRVGRGAVQDHWHLRIQSGAAWRGRVGRG